VIIHHTLVNFSFYRTEIRAKASKSGVGDFRDGAVSAGGKKFASVLHRELNIINAL
jgi:hypothetical protein